MNVKQQNHFIQFYFNSKTKNDYLEGTIPEYSHTPISEKNNQKILQKNSTEQATIKTKK